uniref:Transcriptional regulator, AraC family n=1 Tax=Parastrongyloides trichosuri TaxID=131310 RepID=A0A0N4YZX9_PARTI
RLWLAARAGPRGRAGRGRRGLPGLAGQLRAGLGAEQGHGVAALRHPAGAAGHVAIRMEAAGPGGSCRPGAGHRPRRARRHLDAGGRHRQPVEAAARAAHEFCTAGCGLLAAPSGAAHPPARRGVRDRHAVGRGARAQDRARFGPVQQGPGRAGGPGRSGAPAARPDRGAGAHAAHAGDAAVHLATDRRRHLVDRRFAGRGRLRRQPGGPAHPGHAGRPRRAHPARAARGAGGAQLGRAARDVQGRLSHLSAIRNVPGGLRRHLP